MRLQLATTSSDFLGKIDAFVKEWTTHNKNHTDHIMHCKNCLKKAIFEMWSTNEGFPIEEPKQFDYTLLPEWVKNPMITTKEYEGKRIYGDFYVIDKGIIKEAWDIPNVFRVRVLAEDVTETVDNIEAQFERNKSKHKRIRIIRGGTDELLNFIAGIANGDIDPNDLDADEEGPDDASD